MGDRFTEIHETGFLGNIMASIKGVVVGLILFLASFVVLWWNEGRVDLSKLAETSTPVSADMVDTAANGKFVSVTGEITSEESIGDPQFLKEGPYIELSRKAEMYSWDEHKSSKSRKKVGGGKTTETTYSYNKEWTDNPANSESFKRPAGHENPPKQVENRTFTVREATIGAYRLDPHSARLPAATRVPIGQDTFIPSANARLETDHIFIGSGTLQNPMIGDMRISFTAVESDTMATLFGTLSGDTINPHLYKGDKKFYRAVAGSREAAIAKLAAEHKLITWLLRAGGFLMMWIGLCLFFGPINAVLDFIPFLGSVGRSIVGFAMFFVALALSLVTMLVSMIAHNPLLLLGAVVAVLAAVWALGRIRPRQKLAPAPAGADAAMVRPPAEARSMELIDEDEAMELAVQQSKPATEKIRFECDECGKRYAVKESLAGKKAKCKECGNRIHIPEKSISQA